MAGSSRGFRVQDLFAKASVALRRSMGSVSRSDRSGAPEDSSRVVSAVYSEEEQRNEDTGRIRTLGTFGGVFTPSFLTIIGVIMYLRFSWVLGNAGLLHTIAIVMLANAITFISALSVSSIASNERMETGGAYFMVCRVLGDEAGGGIGLPLYLSQALSIALYVIGFAEAFTAVTPRWSLTTVAITTMLLLAVFGIIGARFMIRLQYVILAIILASFISIAFGFEIRHTNLTPSYGEGLGFWAVFAVFFPAVTGILAGVSMSGDLKEPAKSIPRGTLLAVAAGFTVYILVPVMLAFSVAREDLGASTALRDASRWPLLVTAGVMGATVSSAIGSLLAAPRTLQALGIDGVVPGLFGKGVGPTKEPLLALLVSIGLALAAILLGSLNAVAEVLTMFFLTTYGVLNLSAGMERLVDNPSFRPAIRIPWWVSFLGAAGCVAVMFLINVVSTVGALVAVVAIYVYLGWRKELSTVAPAAHGGVWEGFWTAVFFGVSRRLAKRRSASGKNWRPLVQVFASDPESHRTLMETGAMLTRRGGALAIYGMVERGRENTRDQRRALDQELEDFSDGLLQPNVFPHVVETAAFYDGVVVASQAAAFAGGTYNSVMLGLPAPSSRDREFAAMMERLSEIDRNILLLKKAPRPWTAIRGPIVVWWGGQENNVRLMLVLAHLLQGAVVPPPGIRLATIVSEPEQKEAAKARLVATVSDLRLRAEPKVVVNQNSRSISEILAAESADAALVLLGMAKPDSEETRRYLPRLRETAAGMESVLFVLNNIPEMEYI